MSEDTKMDPEQKARWVEALRSGDYKQGPGALHVAAKYGKADDTHNYYCCLGVQCNLVDPNGWLDEDSPPSYYNDAYAAVASGWQFGANISLDSGDVENIPGIPTGLVDVTDLLDGRRFDGWDVGPAHDGRKRVHVYDFLARANDNGWTFEQIADWIEATL
jgi:hypothetical protein